MKKQTNKKLEGRRLDFFIGIGKKCKKPEKKKKGEGTQKTNKIKVRNRCQQCTNNQIN